MEIWQPYRYLSRPRPAPEPIAELQFHRTTRAVAWAFLTALLVAAALVFPKMLFGLGSDTSDIGGDLFIFSQLVTFLTMVFAPFSLFAVILDHKRTLQTCPNILPLLTQKNALLSRLGLSVILALAIGIGIACAATPSLFAQAGKSTSDMNFGYIFPFVIPAPVMSLLTFPIFATLSWPNRWES